MMSKKYKLALVAGLGILALAAVIIFFKSHDFAVLSPAGPIGAQQRDLILIATLLAVLVIVPVFILTFFIAWKYRESNKSAKYSPDWDHNLALESAWWLIPSLIIVVLSVITWNSSHQLDPFKPIASQKPPMTIQVVALQWKWLFIYPQQSIATVNYVQFPVNTPVRFEITADAPMNSFWIPKLGGQIYAMSGMSTELNLEATETGNFRGSSANLSGRGFSGMNFTAKSTSEAQFEKWMQSAYRSPNFLSMDEYNRLARPTENSPKATYSATQDGLYDKVVSKYMPFARHIHLAGQE
jgi:cytochrome o ubiquinol oxidase subunit II